MANSQSFSVVEQKQLDSLEAVIETDTNPIASADAYDALYSVWENKDYKISLPSLVQKGEQAFLVKLSN